MPVLDGFRASDESFIAFVALFVADGIDSFVRKLFSAALPDGLLAISNAPGAHQPLGLTMFDIRDRLEPRGALLKYSNSLWTSHADDGPGAGDSRVISSGEAFGPMEWKESGKGSGAETFC